MIYKLKFLSILFTLILSKLGKVDIKTHKSFYLLQIRPILYTSTVNSSI